MSKLSGPDNC